MPRRKDTALSVEYRPLDKLIPYARNARTHSDEQVAQIAASIREFGWTNPILVDGENGVVAGHGRLLAARKLEMGQVPVIELAGLTAAQKRAYIIADNKLAENAGWDMELLGLELGELGAEGFDLELIGFGEDELAGLLADRNDGLTDPDDVPEPPVNPVSVAGDLWLCGKHRVLCGDATVATDVERLLDGVTPLLMVTDPPYGVEYDPDWRNRRGLSTTKAIGQVVNDDRVDWREAWALFPGDVIYCWTAPGSNQLDSFDAIVASGFVVRMQIIWAKQHFPIGRGNYHAQHEPCWYAVRKNRKANWQGSRKETTLWQIANRSTFGGELDDSSTKHSTQKPVECMRRPIVNNSVPGQPVYDPFLGSGTTMIAAEMEGRACLGLEIAPEYVDVIVQRWQNFTGQEARLDQDGRTFEEVRQQRESQAA